MGAQMTKSMLVLLISQQKRWLSIFKVKRYIHTYYEIVCVEIFMLPCPVQHRIKISRHCPEYTDSPVATQASGSRLMATASLTVMARLQQSQNDLSFPRQSSNLCKVLQSCLWRAWETPWSIQTSTVSEECVKQAPNLSISMFFAKHTIHHMLLFRIPHTLQESMSRYFSDIKRPLHHNPCLHFINNM